MRLIGLLLTIQILVSIHTVGQVHQFSSFTSYAGLSALNGGHGTVVGDFDGDGLEDLFIPGQGQPNLLLKNMGDSTFQNVISGSGITSAGSSFTAIWADLDNDDDLDLFMGNYANSVVFNANRLYRNDGSGQFSDVTAASGLGTFDSTRSLAVADVDNDGYSDIYICNTLDENILWRNNGDMTFSDVTLSSGTSDPLISMGAVFFDYDNDGDQDLYITHDNNQANILYQNDGTGNFTDVSVQSGLGLAAMGMGVDYADIDNDGWFDVYVTNLGASFLFLNQQDGTFIEIAESAGVTNGGMGWGCFFLDHDNDTDLDLYVVNQYNFAPVPNRLYDNDGEGDFTDIAVGTLLQSTNNGFGGAWFDMDENGYQDILIANIGDTLVELFLNDTQANHWLSIDLKGTVSARDAFGTRVNVYVEGQKFISEKRSASSYSAQSSHRLHFGLGLHEVVDSVQIIFPSGVQNMLYEIPADRSITVIEDPSGQVIDCIPEAYFEWTTLGENQILLTGIGGDDITDWTFEMSDGGTLSEASGVYTFPSSGSYEVCLHVANSCTYSSSCQMIEVICELPVSDFEYQTDGLTFSGTALDSNADSVLWTFGDGQESALSTPEIMYNVEGQYQVCLNAFNICGSTVDCDSVQVICPLPSPDFDYDVAGLNVDFIDQSLFSDSISWDFGDGTVSQSAAYLHSYLSEGTYEVCITAYNGCGESIFCDSISVIDMASALVDLFSEEHILIYPNPVHDELFIEDMPYPILDLYLETLDGKVCRMDYRHRDARLVIGGLGDLPNGYYLLYLRSESGSLVRQVIISH